MRNYFAVTTLLSAALAVVLAIPGCGDSQDGTTTVGVTKAAFIKRADAICAKSYNQRRSGFLSFVQNARDEPFSDIREIRRFADTVLIPTRQQQVEELRALGAPSGDEDDVEAILEAYEEGIEKAEEDPRAAVTSTFGVFVKATELAEEYGLENCR